MKNFTEISTLLSRMDDPRIIGDFLRAILTKNEVKTVCTRWEILKRIESGYSQRTIARDLHLSLCNITRGSRELKRRNSVIKRIFSKYRIVSTLNPK